MQDSNKRIYLAAPYSADYYAKRHERFRMVSRKASELLRDGNLVFSPITHSHYLAERYNCLISDDEWRVWYISFLEYWATDLYVLRLCGWDKSKGVSTEIEYAKKKGLPITYVDYKG